MPVDQSLFSSLPLTAAATSDLLRTVLGATQTGVILYRPVFDAAGNLVDFAHDYLNPSAQQMLGQPERPGTTLLGLRPHAAQTGVLDFMRGAFLSGQPAGMDVNYAFDGLDDFYHVAAYRSGELLVVSATSTAGRPRTAVEEALRTSQAREHEARLTAEYERSLWQAVVAQAPVAIGLFRGEQQVVASANDHLCRMWGYPPAEVLHRPLLEAVPELRGQPSAELLAQVARTRQPYVGSEMPIRLRKAATGDVQEGYFNFIYQPLLSPAGELLGVLDVAVDVTAQVQARRQVQAANDELEARVAQRTEALQAAQAETEAQRQRLAAVNESLRQSNEQLLSTNADLDNFVYTASHDLKQPVNNLEGLLDALREQLSPAVAQAPLTQRILEMMGSSVERLGQTIAHLADIVQLQHQSQARDHVELASMIEAVRLDLLPQFEAAGATLAVDLERCPTVAFSAKNLRSVLYNLLSNAVKYARPGVPPQVQVRAWCQPGAAVIEVEDNGLGLTPAQQRQLFGMFQRLHSHVEGSGVGLYMVKRIVENAGGSIAVRSEPGQGTTFTIALPTA